MPPLDTEGNWVEPLPQYSAGGNRITPGSIIGSMADAIRRGRGGGIYSHAHTLAEWYWKHGYSLAKVEAIGRRLPKQAGFAVTLSFSENENEDRPYYIFRDTRVTIPESRARFRVYSVNGRLIADWRGPNALVRAQEVDTDRRTYHDIVGEAVRAGGFQGDSALPSLRRE